MSFFVVDHRNGVTLDAVVRGTASIGSGRGRARSVGFLGRKVPGRFPGGFAVFRDGFPVVAGAFFRKGGGLGAVQRFGCCGLFMEAS